MPSLKCHTQEMQAVCEAAWARYGKVLGVFCHLSGLRLPGSKYLTKYRLGCDCTVESAQLEQFAYEGTIVLGDKPHSSRLLPRECGVVPYMPLPSGRTIAKSE